MIKTPTALNIAAPDEGNVHLLAHDASPAQKEEFLSRAIRGEWIGAYALSEPNSGSDALSMSTRAEDKGDHWLLNGTKMWITNVSEAT